jgi:hypothetical protein
MKIHDIVTEASLGDYVAEDKTDQLATDRTNLSHMKAQLAQLEKTFDPNYQYSDDYSFWSNQNSIAGQIAQLKKRIQKVDQPIGESRMAEIDLIFQELANGSMDIYNTMNHPDGPEEEYVAKQLQDMYSDISSDYRLHPDDQFEEIIDIIHQRLVDDFGTDDY